MREITQEQFNETISSVLCEVFEFFGQPYYLEVLTNERDFVGRLHECPDHLLNMSDVMQLKDGRYAFQSTDRKPTYFAYDSIADARQHASLLLDESLERLSI